MNSPELIKVQEVVRRIGRALSDGEDPQDLYSLGTQYADYCAVANSRLASCEEILSQGKDKEYAALMHATRAPDILELVAVLSDPELGDWREYCKQNRLPVPDPLNEHAKQKLDPVYSRAESFNDQLFGEYTAAQTRRDFEGALQIIRQISVLNPGDQGAAKQVATLENRLRKAELKKLDKAMQSGDRDEVLKVLDRIEEISPGYEDDSTLWIRAVDTRAAVRREEATEECRSLLAEAESEYGDKNLDAVLRLTAEISGIVEEHDVDLGSDSSELLEEISGWSAKMLQKLREDDRFDRAVLSLEEVVESIRQKEFRATASKLPELRDDKGRLDKAWHDMAQFRRGISADLKDAAEKSNGDLGRKISQIERTRVRTLTGAIALALILTVSASLYTVFRLKARDEAEALKTMVESRQVNDLRERLDELESEKPWTLKFAVLTDEIERAKDWIVSLGDGSSLGEAVAGVEKKLEILKTGWDDAEARNFQNLMTGVQEKIAATPEDLRGDAPDRVEQVTNAWGLVIEKERSVRAAAFRERLDVVEKQIQEELDYNRSAGEVAESVKKIQTELSQLERMAEAPDIPELKLSGADVTKFGIFKDQMAQYVAEIELIGAVTLKLIETNSLPGYFAEAEKLAESKFMRGEQVRNWRALKRLFQSNEEKDFLKLVLMPDDLLRWEKFSAPDATRASRGYPAAVFPAEQAAFLELRDDSDLRDIYRYAFNSPDNKDKVPLYVRTSVLTQTESRVGPTRKIAMQGREVYRPWRNKTFANFEPASFNAQISGSARSGIVPTDEKVSPESAFFNQLALNQYVGDALDVYKDSLLKVVDRLIESPEINPVFRAYVHSQIHRMMDLRADDWGLPWTSFDEDYDRLLKIIKTPLTSSSWMVPIQNESLAGPIAEYYESLGGISYYQQAVVVSRFFSKAHDNGFSYAGFVDYLGKRQSTPTDAVGNGLWGIDEDLNPRILFRRTEEEGEWKSVAKPHSLTPLFQTRTDAEKLIEDSCRQVGADPAQAWIRRKIPTVFFETHE